MKLALVRQGEYPEPIRSELQQMVAAITTSYGREHDAEGRQRRVQGRWVVGATQTVGTGAAIAVGPYRAAAENEGDVLLDNTALTVRVTTAGVYAVTASARWSANATGVRALILVKNSARLAHAQVSAVPGGAIDTHLTVSDPGVPCAAGTLFRVDSYQNSGGVLTLVPSAEGCDQTWLRIVRVS
jgi:hypothetical protein